MVNREHKDRLFGFLFGREENKRWTLSLYNAVSGSSHRNPDDIQITTMGDILYMGMKNDLSFLVTNIMSLYEQQSTFNPNMPLRKLMYAARLYDKYIHDRCLNIYGGSLIPLPTPKLVTFYNGTEEREDTILELRDAFRAGAEAYSQEGQTGGKAVRDAEPDIAVRVRMININCGRNRELMEACRPLGEYAWLVDRIRKHRETMDMEVAVARALDEMPKDFETRKFLIGNRAEVTQMCITEYNEEETMRMFKEEGRKEGQVDGTVGAILGVMESLGLSPDRAIEAVGVAEDEREKYASLVAAAMGE